MVQISTIGTIVFWKALCALFVLPEHLKQPITSAERAERILSVQLDYLKVQTDRPSGVNALLREVNRIASHQYPAKQWPAVPPCCLSSEESPSSEMAAPKRRRLLVKTKAGRLK